MHTNLAGVLSAEEVEHFRSQLKSRERNWREGIGDNDCFKRGDRLTIVREELSSRFDIPFLVLVVFFLLLNLRLFAAEVVRKEIPRPKMN